MKPSEQDLKRMADFIDRIELDAYAEPVSELHTGITTRIMDDILDKYPISKKEPVLDVGCGQGPALEQFQNRGYSCIGITLNIEDEKICRSKGFQVYKMDQSFLSFPDQYFGFIWCRHCLEHSIFPFFTLSEFHRVLKPDACIYLEMPAPETSCRHETNPNHYSVFTKGVWKALIIKSGFEPLEQKSIKVQVLAGPDEYYGFIARKK